ncbi:INSIG domain-containing protein [Geopyxis carbonaria]|nr:INSIG domain-containing protein [Geopyxis carbonaria]
MDTPPLQRPIPRRPFDLPGDTSPTGDFPGTERWLDLGDGRQTPSTEGPPARSKSSLSLNTGASTLFGIYSRGYSDDIGATPLNLSRNPSTLNMASLRTREEAAAPRARTSTAQLALNVASLFVFGVAYGVVVTHLHDRAPVGPVATTGRAVAFDRWSTRYLLLWGLAGVGLGRLLPWLDGAVGRADDEGTMNKAEAKRDWTPAIRSVGAFVGIAFAIRRLPWQSTLQVSLALALVNPFLWFIVDRTRSGFWASTVVGLAGTAALLQVAPQMIQTPAHPHRPGQMVGGVASVEAVAVGTWIASVLFCSCVCFGNVGRKLAIRERAE